LSTANVEIYPASVYWIIALIIVITKVEHTLIQQA